MAIKRNTEGLKTKIVAALQKAKIIVPDVNEETGEVIAVEDGGKEIPFVSTAEEGKVVKFVGATPPTYGELYTTKKETGIEKIAEAIANEVLSYIVENAEVNLKERLDALESDFNALIISLQASGAGMSVAPLTPVGAALTAAATAGGTPARVAASNILKATNEITDIG